MVSPHRVRVQIETVNKFQVLTVVPGTTECHISICYSADDDRLYPARSQAHSRFQDVLIELIGGTD